MARRLLPVVATLLTCLSAFSVSAADKDNPLPETSSERRVQVRRYQRRSKNTRRRSDHCRCPNRDGRRPRRQ